MPSTGKLAKRRPGPDGPTPHTVAGPVMQLAERSFPEVTVEKRA